MERRKELQLILSKDELVAGYGEILRDKGRQPTVDRTDGALGAAE